MPILIDQEPVFPLTQTGKYVALPERRRGRKPCASTLIRWGKAGVRGVRLETIRVGGTLCTSAKAVQRFFDRLSELDDLDPVSTGGSDAKLDQVERELTKRWKASPSR